MGEIAELRRNKIYSFIAYGNIYDEMQNEIKRFEWLLECLDIGHPTSATVHEWSRCRSWLTVKLREYKALLKKLPKPTKEQRNDDSDPFVKGQWPEDKMPAIDRTYDKLRECREFAERAEAVITRTKFSKEIRKDKVYESEFETRTKKKASK